MCTFIDPRRSKPHAVITIPTDAILLGSSLSDKRPIKGEKIGAFALTEPEPNETYAWVCVVSQIAYFIDHRLGLEAAGRELGVRTKFLGPTDYDIPGMIDDIEQLIGEL